jgi:hypothetical protein
MFVVWSGKGFIGTLLPLVLSIIGIFVSQSLFGGNHFKANSIFGVCFILSSPIIWVTGRQLNSAGERKLIDPSTNEVVILKNSHTTFWMPLEYFSVVTMLLGIFWLFK